MNMYNLLVKYAFCANYSLFYNAATDQNGANERDFIVDNLHKIQHFPNKITHIHDQVDERNPNV